NEFIIYGTRKSVEDFTDINNIQTFLTKLEQIHMTVSIGFGYGSTAKEAENNAESALSLANKSPQETSILINNSNKELINPLQKDKATFSIKSIDPALLAIAKKTNTSITTVTKLMHFSKLKGSKGFTSAELSTYLETSRRSGERILKRFTTHGLTQKIGEEQPYKQGRLRSVYRLTF